MGTPRACSTLREDPKGHRNRDLSADPLRTPRMLGYGKFEKVRLEEN